MAKFKPTGEEEDAIRQANALDIQLYEYGLTLFEAQLTRMRAGGGSDR